MLKQVTSDTHANASVKVKQTRTAQTNYQTHKKTLG
jgi:hypothetical protein